jgi:hypothetical protein
MERGGHIERDGQRLFSTVIYSALNKDCGVQVYRPRPLDTPSVPVPFSSPDKDSHIIHMYSISNSWDNPHSSPSLPISSCYHSLVSLAPHPHPCLVRFYNNRMTLRTFPMTYTYLIFSESLNSC